MNLSMNPSVSTSSLMEKSGSQRGLASSASSKEIRALGDPNGEGKMEGEESPAGMKGESRGRENMEPRSPTASENRGNSGNQEGSETGETGETMQRFPSQTVETEKPVCAECTEKAFRLEALQGRIAVMDAELMKLRRRVMEEVKNLCDRFMNSKNWWRRKKKTRCWPSERFDSF